MAGIKVESLDEARALVRRLAEKLIEAAGGDPEKAAGMFYDAFRNHPKTVDAVMTVAGVLIIENLVAELADEPADELETTA